MAKRDLSKLELARQMVESAEHSLHSAKEILREVMGISSTTHLIEKARGLSAQEGGKIVEGVFDGEGMLGPDGQKYPIPANYASKSKLAQGDMLKLTILEDGSFVFKQIGPVERKKVIGTLVSEDGKFRVLAEGKTYNVLLASVTYFKAASGDEVALIVPKEGDSEWGAIEAVIPRGFSGEISGSEEEDLSAQEEKADLSAEASAQAGKPAKKKKAKKEKDVALGDIEL